MFTADTICKMIKFLIDNIYMQFEKASGNWNSKGANCAPLLADLFLYSYENQFLDNIIRSGHRRLAGSFNLCYRYIDDLIISITKRDISILADC